MNGFSFTQVTQFLLLFEEFLQIVVSIELDLIFKVAILRFNISAFIFTEGAYFSPGKVASSPFLDSNSGW